MPRWARGSRPDPWSVCAKLRYRATRATSRRRQHAVGEPRRYPWTATVHKRGARMSFRAGLNLLVGKTTAPSPRSARPTSATAATASFSPPAAVRSPCGGSTTEARGTILMCSSSASYGPLISPPTRSPELPCRHLAATTPPANLPPDAIPDIEIREPRISATERPRPLRRLRFQSTAGANVVLHALADAQDVVF